MMKDLVGGIKLELQKVKFVSPVRAVSGNQQHELEVPLLFSEAQALIEALIDHRLSPFVYF